METEADISGLLQASTVHREILQTVAELDLPDCWIAAGFVRNLVWDHIHGFSPPTPLNDIDVIYFDRGDTSCGPERQIEASLNHLFPNVAWQVRNQARMHLRNNDAPYGSSSDAMAHFPETATAIGARVIETGIQIAAPSGLVDLFSLFVRPTPHYLDKMDIFHARMMEKNWRSIWPRLTILTELGPILSPGEYEP